MEDYTGGGEAPPERGFQAVGALKGRNSTSWIMEYREGKGKLKFRY